MKVLIVSANPAVTAQITTALVGRPGMEFLEVATPERAVRLLDDDEQFDIVIADNDTHPTGGFVLARDVKARAAMGGDMPPVVLLVARKQDAWLSNWSQADAWVLKPADGFDLAEAVDALVEGRPLPALPGIGGRPTPSPVHVPGGEEPSGLGAVGGGGGGLTGGGP